MALPVAKRCGEISIDLSIVESPGQTMDLSVADGSDKMMDLSIAVGSGENDGSLRC